MFARNCGITFFRPYVLWCLVVSILVIVLIMSSGAICAPVNSAQAEAVVRGWLAFSEKPLSSDLGGEIGDVRAFEDVDGLILYYVVYLKPKGYVIVSADDNIEPIIAFSDEGIFALTEENVVASMAENDMRERLAEVLSLEVEALNGNPVLFTAKRFSSARNKWGLYSAAATVDNPQILGLTSIDDVRVPILCQTRWDQDNVCDPLVACYNYYTPKWTGSTSNYPCGCVATAMSQFIRYHEYPPGPIGTRTFNITVDGTGEPRSLRGGDGAGGPYNYDLMVYEPHNMCGTLTLAQRQAIGALTHDTGVSMQTSYTPTISTAATGNVGWGFVEVFQYTNAVTGAKGGSDIGAGLDEMIIPNLDMLSPVVLGVTGDPGGHALVCDGYGYNGGTLYFHINCGWSGQSDAWYNLPTINTHMGTFTSVHTCVYNVYKMGTSQELISGRVLNASGTPYWYQTVQAERVGGGVYTAITNGVGTYAIKVPANGTYDVTVVGGFWMTQTVSTGQSVNNNSTSGNVYGVDFEPKVVKVDPGTIFATEGDTVYVDVWLNQDPGGTVVVNVTGDADLVLVSPSSGQLSFNSGNYSTPQTVTYFLPHDQDAQHNYGNFHNVFSATEWTCPFLVTWITDDDRGIETDTNSVNVPEGDTATFQVRLKGEPSDTVTVDVARSSGDMDITVQDGSSLVFWTWTWADYQTVTLAAAEDVDEENGVAIISCTSSSWTTADVTATELDNDPDSDGDGLPDDWEQQIVDDDPYDDIESIEDVLPGDDYDGDNRSNEDEWKADTDPTDETSYLSFAFIAPMEGFSSVEVQWESSQERLYSIYYCDDPYGDVMSWFLAEDGIPGLGMNEWIDDGSMTGIPPDEVPHRYYMIEVSMPQ